MVPSMMVSLATVKNMDMVFMNGLTVLNIKEIGSKIIFTVMESTHGQTEESIRDNGKIICSMVEVFILGQMEGNMMVSIKMTKNTDKVFIHGLMVKSMTEVGKIANSMAKPHLLTQKDKAKSASGKMAIESNG